MIVFLVTSAVLAAISAVNVPSYLHTLVHIIDKALSNPQSVDGDQLLGHFNILIQCLTNFRKYCRWKEPSSLKHARDIINDNGIIQFINTSYNVSEITEMLGFSKGEQTLVESYLRNVKFLWGQIKQDWLVNLVKNNNVSDNNGVERTK